MDANTFKEPTVITGIGTFVVSFIVIWLAFQQSPLLALFGGLLIGGFVYLIYNDIVQRKQLKIMADKKEETRKASIEDQKQKDLQNTNCISCNKPIEDQKKPCPHCGFERQQITNTG
ncbi:MAG: hypothetical protein INQ03_07975 [Candidatus Heimdallarchaeota archaeon]|nr:hypothetical protein [Candidatus Heimdallarchaeota archaeon]